MSRRRGRRRGRSRRLRRGRRGLRARLRSGRCRRLRGRSRGRPARLRRRAGRRGTRRGVRTRRRTGGAVHQCRRQRCGDRARARAARRRGRDGRDAADRGAVAAAAGGREVAEDQEADDRDACASSGDLESETAALARAAAAVIAVCGVSERIVLDVVDMERGAPCGMRPLTGTGRGAGAVAAAGAGRGRGACAGVTSGASPAGRLGTAAATPAAACADRSILRPGRRALRRTCAARSARLAGRPPGYGRGRSRVRGRLLAPGARRHPHGRARVLLLGHRDPRTSAARAGNGAVEVSSTRLAVVHRDCPEFGLKKLRSNRILSSPSPDFQRPAVSARQKPWKMRAR